MQRRCVRVRAIAREAFPQIGEPSVSPVLLDQARKANPPAPLAAMTRDVEQVELALQLSEGDRSTVAHSRNPNPASAGTISISHCFSTSRRTRGFPKIALFGRLRSAGEQARSDQGQREQGA